MPVKEILVSLENVPGRLSEVNDYLEQNGISIIALSVADKAGGHATRLVVSDPEKAANVLKSHAYSVKMADVLAVEAPNHPGGLKAVLKPLKEVSANINYFYTCLGIREHAVLIIGVDKITEAVQILKENWVHTYNEELYES